MVIAKSIQEELPELKKMVETSYHYFEDNYKRLNRDKRFVYVSTLVNQASLEDIGQPPIECNLIEAFLSRLIGEFAKQEPSITMYAEDGANVPPQTIDFLSNNWRHEECELRKNGQSLNIYREMLCGFSVLEVFTDYKNPMSFDQIVGIRKPFSSDLCGFDPLAQKPDKSDGKYCFKLYPMLEQEFKDKYPNLDIDDIDFSGRMDTFNWSYKSGESGKEKVILLCELYKKKMISKRIVRVAVTPALMQLGMKDTMLKEDYEKLLEKFQELKIAEQPPEIIEERETELEVICRYDFIENQVVKYKETEFPGLPLVFACGNSVIVRKHDMGSVEEFTKSYFHNAIGTQKLANVAMQAIGSDLQNVVQHKFMIPEEAITESSKKALENYQVPNVLVYRAFLEKEGVEPGTVAIPPPQTVQRQPMPPEFLSTLQFCFQLLQNILGTFDSALGINNNQLSGIAIQEAATQSNAAAMPILNNYMLALTRAAELYIKMLPKYILNRRQMPVRTSDGKRGMATVNDGYSGINLNYEENDINVRVEAGPSYQIQKSKTLQNIMMTAQALSSFNEFVNTSDMLAIIIKLMDIPSAEDIYPQVEQFIQQKKQQQAQAANMPNPVMLKLQNEQANIQRESQKDQMQNQIDLINASLKQSELSNEQVELSLKANQAHMDNIVALDKHQTEKSRAAVDLAMNMNDMNHKHMVDGLGMMHDQAMEQGELHHKITKAKLEHQRHEAQESKRQEKLEHE